MVKIPLFANNYNYSYLAYRGKDFISHKALDRFLADEEYNIPFGIVLDNHDLSVQFRNVTPDAVLEVSCIHNLVFLVIYKVANAFSIPQNGEFTLRKFGGSKLLITSFGGDNIRGLT